MSFIQENNIVINIGLKKEYKLIHISDVHINYYKSTDTKEQIEESKRCEKVWDKQKYDFANGHNEHYDDSHKISSTQCLDNLIDYINKAKPNCAILTGDIIDYYSVSNYEYLTQKCMEISVPFLFACGNHETPVNRYKNITKNEEGFMVYNFQEFKIISLDNSTKYVTNKTLELFKKELKDNLPIIVCMHVPLITEYNKDKMIRYGEYFSIDRNNTDETTKEFVDILINNDLVKALLCGHVHGYNESMFTLSKKQYCASSGLIGKVNNITVK